MNLIDLMDARGRRDEALVHVEAGAGDWSARAWDWLLDYLRAHEEFFPDDAWAAGLERPNELRAFGPVVLRAARKGFIVKTGEWRQRTRGHATAAAVWRSTIYGWSR